MEERNICFPNGILLNLYKHIDVAKFDSRISESYVVLKTKVALGNFDRLRFYPIDDFTDFRKQSRTGHLWTGGRRDIMLFSLSNNESERSFRFACNKSELETAPSDTPYSYILPWEIEMLCEGKLDRRNFLSVSMLYLSGKVKNLGLSYKQLIAHCKEAISRIVEKVNCKKKGQKIIFEVFGSLNSAELAILWGSDEYDEIQYLVDQLRYIKLKQENELHRVIYSSYTIVAINDNKSDLTNVRGGSMIQFATSTNTKSHAVDDPQAKDHSNANAIQYIKEETQKLEKSNSIEAGEVYSCAGEYDQIYNGKVPVLNSLVRREGTPQAFDDCNSGFQTHFSSTTTRLYYRADDVKEIEAALKADLDELLLICPDKSEFTSLPPSADVSPTSPSKPLQEWDSLPKVFEGCRRDMVRNIYLKYTEELKKLLCGDSVSSGPYSGLSASNFLYNLDLLFCDYVQCVSTMPDLQWAKDFEYQFFSALNVLFMKLPQQEDLSQSEANPGFSSDLDLYIADAHDVLSVLRYNIHHMSEAGKLFFEEPSSHSESTGQYDLIIHTYYGIIKSVLLEVTKNSQHLFEKPTPLVPILRFSDSPIIKSTLYFDGLDLPRKLVEIRIPYDACGEIGLYSPLLIHEIYHYVPPVDRVARNKAFAIVLLTELTVDRLQLIASNSKYRATSDLIHDLCLKFRELLIKTLLASPEYLTALPDYPGSQNWGVFADNFLIWIKNFDPDQSGKDNFSFVSFFHKVLSTIYQELVSWCKNDGIDEILKDLIVRLAPVIATPKNFIDSLFSDDLTSVKPIMGIGKSECLLYCVSKCDRVLYDDIILALRELLPDYAMLHYADITDLSDYLLLVAIVIDKQFSRAVNTDTQGFLFFRISFVADYLLYQFQGSMDNLEAELNKYESAFCEKYRAYRRLGLDRDIYGSKYTYQNEAQKWFEFFKSSLLNKHEIYLLYRPFFRQLAENQFAVGLCEPREKVWDCLKAPFTALSDPEKQLFSAEVDILRTFQPQVFLAEIEKKYQSPAKSTTAPVSPVIPAYAPHKEYGVRVEKDVESAAAIKAAATMLQEYHRRVFGEQSHAKLWFRGCKSSSFPILPSIMVHFLDRDKTCPNGKNYIGTLVEYQRALLEEFKYRADGASEFINASSYTTADYISLMQHYSQQTCYVDWSDDVYSSLYFALEDEIKEAQILPKAAVKKPTEKEYEPVLYLFDPKLYNFARMRLLQAEAKKIKKLFLKDPEKTYKEPEDLKDSRTAPIYEIIAKDLEEAKHVDQEYQKKRLTDVSVPNVSMRYTAKRYGIHSYELIFHDGPNKDKDLYEDQLKVPTRGSLENATFATEGFAGELWNLPMAIYTSRLNPRIRTQSGNFLAYSIFSRPVCCEDECKDNRSEPDPDRKIKTDYFKYLSLTEIQKYYLEQFEDGLPFLIKVIIPKGEKKALAEYLYHVGINKYRIYPELDNLSLS